MSAKERFRRYLVAADGVNKRIAMERGQIMNTPCKHGHFDGALHAPCYQCKAEHWEAEAHSANATRAALLARIEQFQFCVDKVSQALGVSGGGVDSSPEDQMADPHSTTRVLVDKILALSAEVEPTEAMLTAKTADSNP